MSQLKVISIESPREVILEVDASFVASIEDAAHSAIDEVGLVFFVHAVCDRQSEEQQVAA